MSTPVDPEAPEVVAPDAVAPEVAAPEMVTLYPADASAGDGPRPAVLLLPGGGYGHHAHHESEPVAQWLAGLGLHVAVLRYPVLTQHPGPLRAVQQALAWLRRGEHGLRVDPERVAVLGFSAGGHLASLSAVAAGERPDRVVLCYPVISFVDQPHEGCVTNLAGPDASRERRESLSTDRLVTSQHPPTFLWHTAQDGAVPVGHSLRYAAALAAVDVPVDLHVFARGGHGLGLARPGIDRPDQLVTKRDDVAEWTGLCARWFERAGWC